MQRKVIGSYPICNIAGLAVYEIDESNDRVLVGLNNNLRRELFINSDSLTDRFVSAADAVVMKHSKKEEA